MELTQYDELADWYEERNAPAAARLSRALDALLPEVLGTCLDLGCGTGQYFPLLQPRSRRFLALDASSRQLDLARHRLRSPGVLLRADAHRLPFADATFDSVVGVWISTDVDDFGGVCREAARVLRPGGHFVHLGVHPCFSGPHAEALPDGSRVVHTTYRTRGVHPSAPWWRDGGVRNRIPANHRPLADVLNAVCASGLVLQRVVEPDDAVVPWSLGVRALAPG